MPMHSQKSETPWASESQGVLLRSLLCRTDLEPSEYIDFGSGPKFYFELRFPRLPLQPLFFLVTSTAVRDAVVHVEPELGEFSKAFDVMCFEIIGSATLPAAVPVSP